MDGVLVFGGHGGRGKFAGLSTKEAATKVANGIATASASLPRLYRAVIGATPK